MKTLISQSIKVSKSDINVLEVSKKGTLILDPNSYVAFGFEERPFNLNAKAAICGHTNEKFYHVTYTFFNGARNENRYATAVIS